MSASGETKCDLLSVLRNPKQFLLKTDLKPLSEGGREIERLGTGGKGPMEK